VSYATQQQLVDKFGQQMMLDLTDRASPPAGEIDATVVDRALADADALINGYLKGRYQLPLATTPQLLVTLAEAIAIYNLHTQIVPDKIRKGYEDALVTLKQIATGIVRLDVAGVEPPASGSNGVRVNDRARDMTPDNLKGFV
jgi:phage gp36-like protein